MLKKLILCVLFAVSLYAQKQYELNGIDFDVKDNVISSDDGVVLLHEGKYIYAKKVVYDSNKKEATLFGDVFVIDNNKVSIASEEAQINLKDDHALFVPFFFVDDDSRLWIKGKEGEGRQKLYFSKDSISSSCNPDDPDWVLKFSQMEYDSQAQLLDMYHPILYLKDTPIFYFPFLRVSTNKQRKSGLLRPLLGIGGDDGFFYEQPIFIAPSLWWDLELNPQIRTNRSTGLYTTLRFANSATSNGHLRVGSFKTKKSYQEEHKMEKDSHYGVEFFYDDSNVFSGFEDGLHIDTKYVNDIEYFDLTTQEEASAATTGNKVESKLNYYATDQNYYFGTYLKYYKDTAKESNKNTLQTLPKTQLHKFANTLLIDNILYSVDLTHSNYTRREGVEAQQYEFSLPLTFYTQLFGDYLNLSVSENFYGTKVDFTKGYETYEYYRNFHEISMFTDLIKGYDSFYHNLNFGVSYTHPGDEKEDIKYADLSSVEREFFSITSPSRGYNIFVKQYFYDFDENEIFYHKFNQVYNYDDNNNRVTGEMENTFRFNLYDGIKLNLRTFYNHHESDFSKIITTFSLKKEIYDMTIRHLYANDFEGQRDSYLTLNAGYNFGFYRLFAGVDYDYTNRYVKKKKIGFRMKKRCWDYTITFSEDVTPTLTKTSSNSKKDRQIMFEINLVPLGGIAQKIL